MTACFANLWHPFTVDLIHIESNLALMSVQGAIPVQVAIPQGTANTMAHARRQVLGPAFDAALEGGSAQHEIIVGLHAMFDMIQSFHFLFLRDT